MYLIRNAIQTPDGTILESRHRHDYQTHTDKNGKIYMVDGGLDYIRCSVHDDQIDLFEYSDAPHERQRQVVTWGTYGIDGNQELKYKTIAEMEASHIGNVLNIRGIAPHIRDCMREELRYRKDNDITE